ncbi:hypothetical protein DRE_00441 [Drechslerella stenobrocha 248]|uniref:Uracil catabolism protein 4 n=1 Tax=Drechslerella stenobrocha 248 TaxID=1043628 RepID=W7I5N2_9PEZI|nr:hypothetical protein DRE_00441 [Drechslerella stenobrocha 248]
MGLFSKKSNAKSTLIGTNDVNHKESSTSVNSSIKSPVTPGTMSFAHDGIPASMSLPSSPNPWADPVVYLRSLYAIRERTKYVIDAAEKQQLTNFIYDKTKLSETARYVVSIIKRDYAPDYHTIPPYGRWQHFEVGGRKRIDLLLTTFGTETDVIEKTKRLIDLFVVSVLLDAGAGTKWTYKSKDNGRIYRRSEGLAVASLDMFKDGLFSSDPHNPFRVDGSALKLLMPDSLARGLQTTPTNPIDGLHGRAGLLRKLGQALDNKEYFGLDNRPGNMIEYLMNHPTTQIVDGQRYILVPTLWTVLCEGLTPIWPQSRTQLDGCSLGDAWQCSTMPPGQYWERIIPFHKLTQWLTYSLMVPMSKLMGVKWVGEHLLTGLPEYRNGGLFIDTGLLTLKPQQAKRGLDAYHANSKKEGQPNVEVVPMFSAEDDVIVEWRALTVQLLDRLLPEVNKMLGLQGPEVLTLGQMLEAGTWKGGRELAEVSRPNTKEPPIMILSDGTVF